MKQAIHNKMETIDGRDIISRISYLKSLSITKDEEHELKMLKKIAEEAGSCNADFPDCAILVTASCLEDCAEEFYEDMGVLDELPDEILRHINWEGVAQEMKESYAKIDFGGEIYYIERRTY